MAQDITTESTERVLVPHQIILRPLVTEKGMHRSTRYNAYAFEVTAWPPRTTCAGPSKNCSTSRCCGCTRRIARASRAARGSPAGTPRTGRKPSSSCTRSIASTSSSRHGAPHSASACTHDLSKHRSKKGQRHGNSTIQTDHCRAPRSHGQRFRRPDQRRHARKDAAGAQAQDGRPQQPGADHRRGIAAAATSRCTA